MYQFIMNLIFPKRVMECEETNIKDVENTLVPHWLCKGFQRSFDWSWTAPAIAFRWVGCSDTSHGIKATL